MATQTEQAARLSMLQGSQNKMLFIQHKTEKECVSKPLRTEPDIFSLGLRTHV